MIRAPASGVVQDILVRQGQQVRAGDVLIRLDPTQTGAEFGSGEATVSALNIKIARLEAEITGREPAYPATRVPALLDQIRIEQALHASRMGDLASIVGAARAWLVWSRYHPPMPTSTTANTRSSPVRVCLAWEVIRMRMITHK